MSNSRITQQFHRRLQNFHSEQRGAVALLVLAALLIMLMISMVIYDTGEASRDKINLSAAADTAAWSQAAVQARSMNMITFANVAKRVTVGMTSFYIALWRAYVQLGIAALALTIACWVADVFTFGAITAVCEQLSEITIKIGKIIAEEAPDRISFNNLNKDYFLKDVTALDDYQIYMEELTPWWGWSEQLIRGIRNGALATVSFPTPPTTQLLPVNFDLSGMLSQSPHNDELPATKLDDYESSWDNMCERVYKIDSVSDNIINPADTIYKSGYLTSGDWKVMLIGALTTGMAALQVRNACKGAQKDAYGKPGAPFELRTYSTHADWRLASSNLVFAYKDDKKRMSDSGKRQKLSFLSPDYSAAKVYKSGGYWAFSSSEISFQHNGEAPNMWYPAWTARMRPVALPGDWDADDTQMKNAWRDVAPYFAIATILGGSIDLTDALRMEQAASGLNKSNVQGVSR